jgi:hypothetical protein
MKRDCTPSVKSDYYQDCDLQTDRTVTKEIIINASE